MYNLTFDNPYNREIVRKLKQFRNKQQGFFVPTNIEPEHIVHHYDPITITGGSINHISHPIRPGALIHYPPDLFEPIQTLNRNKMVGNRMKGGSSDLLHQPYEIPTNFGSGRITRGKASFDNDVDINDLGAIHSKRRSKKEMIGGNERKAVSGGSADDFKIPTPNLLPKKVVDKLKNIKKGGNKCKNPPEPKPSSKLLKIFN
jgi:hypothetical protein